MGGGNEALLLRLLGEFRREQAGAAEAMDQAIRAGRLGEAERLAHTLKGVAGNLGAKRLHAEAALLEKALAQGTPAAVAGLAETLRATLAAIRAQATAEGATSARLGRDASLQLGELAVDARLLVRRLHHGLGLEVQGDGLGLVALGGIAFGEAVVGVPGTGWSITFFWKRARASSTFPCARTV